DHRLSGVDQALEQPLIFVEPQFRSLAPRDVIDGRKLGLAALPHQGAALEIDPDLMSIGVTGAQLIMLIGAARMVSGEFAGEAAKGFTLLGYDQIVKIPRPLPQELGRTAITKDARENFGAEHRAAIVIDNHTLKRTREHVQQPLFGTRGLVGI